MPSLKIHNSKWRSLLAHLAPPSLSIKSASCIPSADTSYPPSTSTLANSCPIALGSDISFGSHPSSVCRPSSGLRLHLDSAAEAISSLEPDLIAPCNSSPLSNDVEQLLDMCLDLDRPYDLDKQIRSLDALCTLCLTTPGAADRCVDSGGIEILLRMLNSSPQPSHTSLSLIPSPCVEKSEKALCLLHLITTASEAGCAAALRQTTAIITTLGKKLLRVSEACTASAITILCTICCQTEAALFRKAVSETAIPSKLVVVLQVASKDSTKRRAGKLLRLIAQQEQAA